MNNLQTKLIYKYSFSNPLFMDQDLLLNWDLSETVLITAYDLLKDDYLVNYLSRTGGTLKDYLHKKGFNKNIKILADTGIFEFEARKSHMDIEFYESVPHEFTLNDIYHAYELIDPDFLISPDDIILQSDSIELAHSKVKTMIDQFYMTCDKFPASKQKIIPVIQGFDEPTISSLVEIYSAEKISLVARGGLIPLWTESIPKFEEVAKLTQLIIHDYGIDTIHSFGLPSLSTIKTYFVDNSYDSLDTSIVYYRTAQRLFLTEEGYFISVNKGRISKCGCKGCKIMLSNRSRPNSSQFVVGLY